MDEYVRKTIQSVKVVRYTNSHAAALRRLTKKLGHCDKIVYYHLSFTSDYCHLLTHSN